MAVYGYTRVSTSRQVEEGKSLDVQQRTIAGYELKVLDVSLHMIDLGGDVTGNGISDLVFTILSAVTEAARQFPVVTGTKPMRLGKSSHWSAYAIARANMI